MSLGARNFLSSPHTLQFDINSTQSKQKLVVLYNRTSDLYEIKLYQGNLLNLELKEHLENIYVSDLNRILLTFDKENKVVYRRTQSLTFDKIGA